MAAIFNAATGALVLLKAEHVFGRNAVRSDTHLAAEDVSMMQATVRWRDGNWVIKSHGRNPTRVDGHVLKIGDELILRTGNLLQLGAAPGCLWEVRDVCPPTSALVPLNSLLMPVVLGRSQLLPSAESAEIAIYQSPCDEWILESDGEPQKLVSGALVRLRGEDYRFLPADVIDDTADSLEFRSAKKTVLSFSVSSDEERVRLRLVDPIVTVDLGERSHHYCLVTLARKRLVDAKSGLPAADQGWLECQQLAKMLGIEAAHLNIQIYRLRNQMMEARPDIPELASVVERRRRHVRLGDFAFEIQQGARPEGRYSPSSRRFSETEAR